ncbi:PCD1 [Candida oxycetoniae]|uniref:PCD1 n=1 Tax=Candida oxycetoniae TaxID=497107 RepID=A0AAI9T118_9ASCO|nr:PCD1 [Candida oxycetoniae]KAI3406906.2 PCD1 [Candida oxycetoniae]
MTHSFQEYQLIDNLRHYVAPTYSANKLSVWHRVPVSRRSAVFVLLFLGKMGELRVLLTKRSSKLRNFPGHVALPGGKADNGLESEWTVSRREMHEETGLSSDDEALKLLGVSIEHITLMPSYLSRTFSCVRPCVGFMKFDTTINHSHVEDIEETIISRLNISLNPGESSSIFSCPLKDFLYPTPCEKSSTTPSPALEALERVSYRIKWGGIPWHLRSYIFLQNNTHEVDWLKHIKDLSASEDDEIGNELDSEDKESVTPPPYRSKSPVTPTESTSNKASNTKASRKKKLSSWGRLGSRKLEDTNEKIYDVWGLTANILHDLSEIVYLKGNKNKEHVYGEEEMIYCLHDFGHLMRHKERSEEEVKLIHSTSVGDDENEFGFHMILPPEDFKRLNKLYKL